MGQILQNWRVVVATFIAAVFITGSFMLARGIKSPSFAQASTESALLQAIATKDSDGDGLSDWEEALYGTDPHLIDTFKLGMTDGEVVAKGLIVPKAIADISVATSSKSSMPSDGSLTAAFAKNFFTLYVSAKQANGGANLTQSEVADLSSQALSSLSSAITSAPDYKSVKDLTVSGSGIDALKTFAANAEAVFMKNTSDASKSEVLYLQDAIQNNDTTAISRIASIAKSYRDGTVGLAALPVPQELAASDLALVNAMMRVSEIISDFARVNTDPLTAMLALQQYVPASRALGKAFTDISNVYAAADIVLPAGTPGASFVNVIIDMTAKQQVANKNL